MGEQIEVFRNTCRSLVEEYRLLHPGNEDVEILVMRMAATALIELTLNN